MILDIDVQEITVPEEYAAFKIVKSADVVERTPVLPPDIATCSHCEKELHDPRCV